MIIINKLIAFFLFVLIVFSLSMPLHSHKIVGEITPLMTQIQGIQSLLESENNEQTFSRVQKLYDYNKRNKEGLYQCLIRMDKEFGTSLKNKLNDSIVNENPMSLKKTLQAIAFLLMLEKFNFIQENFNNSQYSSDVLIGTFWSGRNYFSLLLEPELSKYDPRKQTQMDRLLNRMLYSIEDGKWEKFQQTKVELIKQIDKYFDLGIPEFIYNKQ